MIVLTLICGGFVEVLFFAFIIYDLILCSKKREREDAKKDLKKHIKVFLICSVILGISIFGLNVIQNEMFEVKQEINQFEITSYDGGTYYYKVGNKYNAVNASDNNVFINVQPNSKPVIHENMFYKEVNMNKVLYYIFTIGCFNEKRIEYEVVLPREPGKTWL